MKLREISSNQGSGDVIVTHGDLDGLTAAYWIIKYLEKNMVNYEVYASMNPSAEETTRILQEEVGDKRIRTLYILDRALMDQSKIDLSNVEHVVYIDHHQSNSTSELVSITFDKIFDSSKYESAANLAKDYVLSLDRNLLDVESLNKMNDFTTWVWLWDTFQFKFINDYFGLTQEDAEMAQKLGKYQKETSMDDMLDDILYFADLSTIIKNKIKDRASKFDQALQEVYNKSINDLAEVFLCTQNKVIHAGILKLNSRRFVTNIADKYFTENPIALPILLMHLPDGACEIRVRMDHSFNASEFAVNIGKGCGFSGGGHPKAAGFKFGEKGVNDNLEFLNIVIPHLK